MNIFGLWPLLNWALFSEAARAGQYRKSSRAYEIWTTTEYSEIDNIFHSTIFYNIMCLATVIYSTKRDKYKNNGI